MAEVFFGVERWRIELVGLRLKISVVEGQRSIENEHSGVASAGGCFLWWCFWSFLLLLKMVLLYSFGRLLVFCLSKFLRSEELVSNLSQSIKQLSFSSLVSVAWSTVIQQRHWWSTAFMAAQPALLGASSFSETQSSYTGLCPSFAYRWTVVVSRLSFTLSVAHHFVSLKYPASLTTLVAHPRRHYLLTLLASTCFVISMFEDRFHSLMIFAFSECYRRGWIWEGDFEWTTSAVSPQQYFDAWTADISCLAIPLGSPRSELALQ